MPEHVPLASILSQMQPGARSAVGGMLQRRRKSLCACAQHAEDARADFAGAEDATKCSKAEWERACAGIGVLATSEVTILDAAQAAIEQCNTSR